MQTKLWLLALAVLMAGCSEDAAEPSDEPTTTTATTTTSTNGGGDANATARSVALGASSLSGVAPLNVTFDVTIDGFENGTTYRFDFGDGEDDTGAAAASFNVTHQYPEGVHQALLDVTFPDGDVLNATLAFNVTAGGAASGSFVTEQAESYSGTILIGTQGDTGCAVEGSVDKATHTFTLPSDVDGTPVKGSKFVVHMDIGTTNVDSDVYLFGPDGVQIGASTDFNAPGLGSGEPVEDFTAEGDFAAGDYTVEVHGCTGVQADYDVQVTATLVVA